MKQFAKQMLRNPSGLIGLIILLIAVVIAVFGPMIVSAIAIKASPRG